MPRLLPLGLAGTLFLLASLGIAVAQPATGAGGIAGRCDAAPPLEGMLQRNDGVERIVNIECDRITLGDTQVAFLHRRDIKLRLAGRLADSGDFNIESVRLGEEDPVPVSGPGRCRFYARGNTFGIAMCFAQYQQGGQKRAVVVAFTGG
jgi:hypothetical protein